MHSIRHLHRYVAMQFLKDLVQVCQQLRVLEQKLIVAKRAFDSKQLFFQERKVEFFDELSSLTEEVANHHAVRFIISQYCNCHLKALLDCRLH